MRLTGSREAVERAEAGWGGRFAEVSSRHSTDKIVEKIRGAGPKSFRWVRGYGENPAVFLTEAVTEVWLGAPGQ